MNTDAALIDIVTFGLQDLHVFANKNSVLLFEAGIYSVNYSIVFPDPLSFCF